MRLSRSGSPMNRQRSHAFRVVLAGIVAGLFAATPSASAQGSFALGAPLATGRTGHTASRLNDGSVLIVGGEDALQTALKTTEIFVPGPDTLHAGRSLNIAPEWHTASALQDGPVL